MKSSEHACGVTNKGKKIVDVISDAIAIQRLLLQCLITLYII